MFDSELLQYHLLDSTLCSAAFLGPASYKTVEGQKISLDCDVRDTLSINEVHISDTDIVATNGVIHALDTLLIPDSGQSAPGA